VVGASAHHNLEEVAIALGLSSKMYEKVWGYYRIVAPSSAVVNWAIAKFKKDK